MIAQNERMVAINSAIEVDFTGQVCADSIGPQLYSGVGGQLDLSMGLHVSKGRADHRLAFHYGSRWDSHQPHRAHA